MMRVARGAFPFPPAAALLLGAALLTVGCSSGGGPEKAESLPRITTALPSAPLNTQSAARFV